jgi:hypothetical protein
MTLSTKTNSVGTPYAFLWGQYNIQFLKHYIFLFLNNSQRIEPKNIQNDSYVAYLNMNWQEAVTENFRTKFPLTATFRAEEILAKTNAWVCTYLLRGYESFHHQVWTLAFVLCETQATSFREQRPTCLGPSIHPVLCNSISSAYNSDVYFKLCILYKQLKLWDIFKPCTVKKLHRWSRVTVTSRIKYTWRRKNFQILLVSNKAPLITHYILSGVKITTTEI